MSIVSLLGRQAWEGRLPWLAWDAWRATRGGPAAIAERQRARLAGLIHFARRNSRYYGELYRDLPADGIALRRLPPVTKRDLMARFDEWVTDPAIRLTDLERFVADPARVGELYAGRYLVWHTSGSSGSPAVLVQDRRALTVSHALNLVRGLPAWLSWRDVATFVRRGRRAAAILITGAHWATYVDLERSRRRHWWRRGKTLLLSVTLSLPDLVRELDAFQPGILGGYATVLTLLAHEQEAGRLHIRPALVISGAETLPRAMRVMMEQAFACPVRETHLSSEAELAFDCGQGSFHVNDDWVVLEPVDETYQPTPPGRPSHSVLVTNLANRVQPLIRYDLGDSVSVKSEPCPCGSPLTAISIEGRTDHILDFAAPDGTRIRLPPLALTTIVYDTPGVHRYQVIQTAPDRLSIRLQATRAEEDGVVWAAVRDRLTTYLTQQGLIGVTVDRRPEPPAPDPRGGKFHHVWSELQPRTRQG